MNIAKLYRGVRNPSKIEQAIYSKLYSDDYIYSRVSKTRKHAWLVAAPKSGSSWLSIMLTNALGWQHGKLVPVYGWREQEVETRQLMLYSRTKNLFSVHQHCKFNEATLDMINRANIKVILQLRNIFDTVISAKDHMNNETTIFIPWMDDKNWEQLSDEQKTNLIIDMAVPWYFNFFASWIESEIVNSNRVHICTYEKLVKDPMMELQGVLNFLEEERSIICLQKAIEDAQGNRAIRLNKGITGRGKSTLTDEQKARIISYAQYYPTINFNLIGIPSPLSQEQRSEL